MTLSTLFDAQTVGTIVIAIAMGLVLRALRPVDRGSAVNALVLLAAAVIARFGALAAASMDHVRAAETLADAGMVVLGIVVIRLGGLLLFRVALPAVRFRVVQIAQDLVIFAAVIGWVFVWLRTAGVDPTSLFTTSAVITAVIAFSMQDTLGNILGGIVLQLDDSVEVGDWVRVDEVSGRIVDIRWRHTAIETRNRETVIVPNSWLMKNRFTVVGARDDGAIRWRRWVWFNVDLDSAPSEVCRVLVKSVVESDIPHVLSEPAPTAVLMDTADGYGRYALRYWLDEPREDDPTDSLVRAHALTALARHRMRLAVRREEHFLVKENEARHAALEAAETARRRAALDGVDLFAPLSDDEKNQLASHLVYAPFAKGDVVTRQGAIAHWLYLVVAGEADIWFENDAERTHVAVLTPGTIFGEMGMLTGEPRRATVTARTDLTCYRLDKAGFEIILRGRPDIAGEISGVLETRITQLMAKRDSARNGQRTAPKHADILEKIREFFGLD
jgi:small-conductance mechanosensitive channel